MTSEPRLDFRPAVLQALAEIGGRGRAATIAGRALALLQDRMTLQDHLKLGRSNEIRWQRDLRIAIDRLVAAGLLTVEAAGTEWALKALVRPADRSIDDSQPPA